MSPTTANPTRRQLDELDELLQRMLSLPLNPTETAAAPPPSLPPQPTMGLMPPSATFTFSDTVSAPNGHLHAPPPPQMMPPVAPPRPLLPPAPPPRPIIPPARRLDPTPGDPTWSVPLPSNGTPAPALLNTWPMGIEAMAQQMRQAAPAANNPTRPLVPTGADPAGNHLAGSPHRLRVDSIPAPEPHPQPNIPTTPIFAPSLQPAGELMPISRWPAAAIDWICGNLLAMLGTPGQWLGKGGGKILIGWAGWLMLAGAIAWGVVDYLGLSW